jgi:hypothetical protein
VDADRKGDVVRQFLPLSKAIPLYIPELMSSHGGFKIWVGLNVFICAWMALTTNATLTNIERIGKKQAIHQDEIKKQLEELNKELKKKPAPAPVATKNSSWGLGWLVGKQSPQSQLK